MHTPASLVYTLLLVSAPSYAAYNLLKEYSGQSFFTGWDFEDGFDNTTNGAVNWLNQSAATTAGLISVNDKGNVIIKVDDTTNLPNVTVVTDQQKRDSVEISTHDFFPIGSVFVFDAVHVPFGCSVWPSFWTRGPNWPNGGEIDILESVNRMTNNQMALHTTPGCTQPADVTQLGTPKGTDCSSGTDSRVGCAVSETQDNSFGEGFNNAGGGVWAAQFDTTGIFVWFWTRDSIPSDVSKTSKSVDPTTWGTPSAAWPASSCNISNFFTPQQLVIDVTLCGDFAGQPNVYQSTCGQPGVDVGPNTCYTENVNGTGANYADAFFEISYVSVFSLSDTVLAPSVSGTVTVLNTANPSATASGNGNGNGGGNSTTTDDNGGGNGAVSARSVGVSALGVVVAAFVWVLM